jgi:uncharacterized membrane protein YobD (UPF0266 family)
MRKIWLYAIVVLSADIIWYYHAHQLGLMGTSVQIWNMDKWANWNMFGQEMYWRITFYDSIMQDNLTMGFAILALAALCVRRENKWDWFIDCWFLSALIQNLVTTYGSFVQDYYTMELTVPCAILVARFFFRLYRFVFYHESIFSTRKFSNTFFSTALKICLIFITACLSYKSIKYAYVANKINFGNENKILRSPQKFSLVSGLYLGTIIKEHTPKKAIVYTMDYPSPAAVYFSERSGFRDSGYGFGNNPNTLKTYLENSMRKVKHSYIAGCDIYQSASEKNRKEIFTILNHYKKIFSENGCFIYKIG